MLRTLSKLSSAYTTSLSEAVISSSHTHRRFVPVLSLTASPVAQRSPRPRFDVPSSHPLGPSLRSSHQAQTEPTTGHRPGGSTRGGYGSQATDRRTTLSIVKGQRAPQGLVSNHIHSLLLAPLSSSVAAYTDSLTTYPSPVRQRQRPDRRPRSQARRHEARRGSDTRGWAWADTRGEEEGRSSCATEHRDDDKGA